jgi:hypothetical protein
VEDLSELYTLTHPGSYRVYDVEVEFAANISEACNLMPGDDRREER